MPRDVVARIVSFLPRGVLRVTPARVCREWAAVAGEVRAAKGFGRDGERRFAARLRARAAAKTRQARRQQQADREPDEAYAWLPLWYVDEALFQPGHITEPWPLMTRARRRAAVKAALYNAQLDVMDFLYGADEDALLRHNPPALVMAAEGGRVSALGWVAGRPKLMAAQDAHSTAPCNAAARGGHVAALRWLHDKGFPWSRATCSRAARGGHLRALRLLRQAGCPCSLDAGLAEFVSRHEAVCADGCQDSCDDAFLRLVRSRTAPMM
jgi:hypothetical protein